MGLLFNGAAVFNLRQALLQLNTSHTALPKPCLSVYCDFSADRSSCASAKVAAVTTPCSGLSGLCGSIHLEQVAQFHARLMQLRLAVADRASHDACDLIMFVTLHVVQHENRTITGRETVHCLLQLQPVNGPGQRHIFGSEIFLRSIFFAAALRGFLERNYRETLLSQMHQHDVYR